MGYLKCEVCGKQTEDVSYCPNSYAQEIGNDPDAHHTVCGDCDYDNRMDI